MLLKDAELKRAAARLVSTLVAKDLLEPTEKPEALETRVFDTFKRNLKEETEIDIEAERMLGDLRRQTVGMDQRKMLQKIKEKIARDRGFVL